MALATVQDFVDQARTLAQDKVVPYRYSDDDIVAELNDAILEARRLRPDLFLQYRKANPYPSFTAAAMNAAVPFEDVYRVALVYYLVGKITMRDEEDLDEKRGAGFVQKFTAQFISLPG